MAAKLSGHGGVRAVMAENRIGELLALRWMALDVDDGTLAVRESVFEGTFQRPKTQRAMRTIPLGPRAVQGLKAHRERATRTAD